MIRQGVIARCGLGRVGIVTDVLPQRRVENERTVEIWRGVTIWPLRYLGQPWQSRIPVLLYDLTCEESGASVAPRALPAPGSA